MDIKGFVCLLVAGFMLTAVSASAEDTPAVGRRVELAPQKGLDSSQFKGAFKLPFSKGLLNADALKTLECQSYCPRCERPEEDCTEPMLNVSFTQATCTHHRADACGDFLEGDCDGGFREGETVVTDGDYTVHWAAKNAYVIWDSCHDYFKITTFDGEEGDVPFTWDGPRVVDPPPTGFHMAWLFRKIREAVDPVSTAWAGGGSTVVVNARRGGRFDCVARALGKCGRVIEVPYSYSCTNSGASFTGGMYPVPDFGDLP